MHCARILSRKKQKMDPNAPEYAWHQETVLGTVSSYDTNDSNDGEDEDMDETEDVDEAEDADEAGDETDGAEKLVNVKFEIEALSDEGEDGCLNHSKDDLNSAEKTENQRKQNGKLGKRHAEVLRTNNQGLEMSMRRRTQMMKRHAVVMMKRVRLIESQCGGEVKLDLRYRGSKPFVLQYTSPRSGGPRPAVENCGPDQFESLIKLPPQMTASTMSLPAASSTRSLPAASSTISSPQEEACEKCGRKNFQVGTVVFSEVLTVYCGIPQCKAYAHVECLGFVFVTDISKLPKYFCRDHVIILREDMRIGTGSLCAKYL